MRRVTIIKLCLFGVLVLVAGGFIGYGLLGMKLSMGDGSMDEALKLRPNVDAMPEPAETFGSRTGEFGIRFENGEWLTGVAKDSHALYAQWNGGGTVVLKDSRGRVRCFFGHVCGGGSVFGHLRDVGSLEDCDAKLNQNNFQEQPWP